MCVSRSINYILPAVWIILPAWLEHQKKFFLQWSDPKGLLASEKPEPSR